MRLTRVLLNRANDISTTAKGGYKSMALSVYFKQPELGMKEYEILSRASCFLLSVDPPKPTASDGPYGHLDVAEEERRTKEFRNRKKYTPAEGGRKIMDLGWLEFVPREHRPNVHIVASSHVLSPFLWKDYYPQDWLSRVKQEHCKYALEVFDPADPQTALAKLGLDSSPYHHPEGRDISLVHFQEEKSSLKLLDTLGVDILYLRNPENLFSKGEEVSFDGYVVSEPNATDSEQYKLRTPDHQSNNNENEDIRIFCPYREKGTLAFHTNDRFFATTSEPLPEGLCGAPVLDSDGALCGTVEGIVPVEHENKKLAGAAAFMPSYVMSHFIDYVERSLVQQMMPKDLFDLVVTAKKTNSVGGGALSNDEEGSEGGDSIETAYDATLAELKKRYSAEEVDAIMETIDREGKEVMEIMNKEGGDMEEVMGRVRSKTMQIRAMVQDQYEKSREADNDDVKAS